MQKTIAILTNFMDFNPGYSVSSIIIDQAYMLARHNHKVVIYVSEQYNDKFEGDVGLESLLKEFPENIKILKLTKFLHLVDYEKDEMTDDHKSAIQPGADVYVKSFCEEGINVAFTHDFIYTGWNLPFYHMIKETDKILCDNDYDVKWLHWIHSVPVPDIRKPWWDLKQLGENHSVVFPNKTEVQRVAESYQCETTRVKAIPHIKDIRNWYDFGKDSRKFIDMFPNIMDAEVIQVYPVSSDRLVAKQLDAVIKIFGFIKANKIPVFLVVANQWATLPEHKEDISKWMDGAYSYGLMPGEDIVFTSLCADEWNVGIGKRMIRELQLLSNLFIFPTREESFGLVGPEAVFSGALPIANKSLQMMTEVLSIHCPKFDFGSYSNDLNIQGDNPDQYYKNVAMAILQKLYSNDAILTKIYCRTRYHMENIYRRYYAWNIQ